MPKIEDFDQKGRIEQEADAEELIVEMIHDVRTPSDNAAWRASRPVSITWSMDLCHRMNDETLRCLPNSMRRIFCGRSEGDSDD